MTTGFENGLEVCIGNRGYYAQNELHDAWLTLPKTEEEIGDFLKEHQLRDAKHEEIYISDYNGWPFDMNKLFGENAMLSDLNLLATQLQDMDDRDVDAVNAWIKSMYTPKDIIQFMNLIEQAEDIQYFEYAYDNAMWSNEEKFGWEMLDNNPEVKDFLDEHSLMNCFDVEHYGHEKSYDIYLDEDGYLDMYNDSTDMDSYDRDDFIEKYGE